MEMKSAQDCWIEAENNIKNIDYKTICNFGISVLDDALKGILPNDLILIGADSGVGKSELALDMAMHNAMNGKKVALYFIEGGCEEAINRIRWKLIRKKYYEEGHNTVDLDYIAWRMNSLKSPLIDELNKKCYLEFCLKVKDNLQIYSFEEGFTISMLMNSLGYFTKQKIENGMLINDGFDVNLIIIDHLQYFTLTNESNEFTEMTKILMKVKEITNCHKIPVVLISHLRKKDKDRGLPGQDDFFGTSNACKISSQSITIASNYQKEDYYSGIYPTFFRFVKSRTGLRPSTAALINFNSKLGKYEDKYNIHKLVGDKPMEEPLEKYKLPKWARKESYE